MITGITELMPFLGMKILESAQKQQFQFIDSHLVLETNAKMRAEYEKLGGTVEKRYRIYAKKSFKNKPPKE